MNQGINLNNNDLSNGYIYQDLIRRIETLEKSNQAILTAIETAKNDMTISVKDYVSILKEIEKKAGRDEFIHHIEDSEIHVHRSKTLESEIESSTDE